ncbi:MAG: hypothetical protein ACRDBL_15280 [Rhabdaerophilum sp.]
MSNTITQSKINAKKSAAFAIAIAAIGSAAFASAAEARPRHWGYGAAALAGGLVLGSVLAGSAARSAPVYVEEDEAPSNCYMVERVNRFGEVIGLRRVCPRSMYR